MTTHTAVEDHKLRRSECWCCGATTDPARMVHLGNHPEVALCLRCGHWIALQARGIEDRDRTGPTVRARDGMRAVRRRVIDRGWQHNLIVGPPLRWLGKHLP